MGPNAVQQPHVFTTSFGSPDAQAHGGVVHPSNIHNGICGMFTTALCQLYNEGANTAMTVYYEGHANPRSSSGLAQHITAIQPWEPTPFSVGDFAGPIAIGLLGYGALRIWNALVNRPMPVAGGLVPEAPMPPSWTPGERGRG